MATIDPIYDHHKHFWRKWKEVGRIHLIAAPLRYAINWRKESSIWQYKTPLYHTMNWKKKRTARRKGSKWLKVTPHEFPYI